MLKTKLNIYTQIILDRQLLYKALIISVVVGTILNFINQGDLILAMEFERMNQTKAALTYLVPFLVSTYTAVTLKLKFQIGTPSAIDTNLKCKCGNTTHVKEHEIIPECKKCGLLTKWSIAP